VTPAGVVVAVVVLALIIAPRKAAAATRTQNGPEGAVSEIREFVRALKAEPLPPGVKYYAMGNTTRSKADADRVRAAGLSRAQWGESPHHYDPSYAIDIFPIVAGDVVSNDPTDYEVIARVAQSRGLVSGKSWNDWPHVETANWRVVVGGVA
jgi:hypothetical protein